MSTAASIPDGFHFAAKHHTAMDEIIGCIRTILADYDAPRDLDAHIFGRRASDTNRHSLYEKGDVVVFFGDAACWLLERSKVKQSLNTVKNLPVCGVPLRVDGLNGKTANDEQACRVLSTGLLRDMAQCVLQKKKIWLVTGSISSLVIDYIHSVLVTVYKLHKPDCSSREPYSNIKIHHIEVHSGYSQVDASSKFADTRWLLQDQLSYIPRYPEYGPRMPKANWTKPYATLLAQWKTNNRHFAMLRLSLGASGQHGPTTFDPNRFQAVANWKKLRGNVNAGRLHTQQKASEPSRGKPALGQAQFPRMQGVVRSAV